MLATPIEYVDVTNYKFDQQIPRPQNEEVYRYLQSADSNSQKVSDHTDDEGRFALHIAGVARNYVGIRNEPSSSVNTLRFATKEAFHRIFWIVSSDLFMDYWLTVGVGFHITRSNVKNFPISDALLGGLGDNLSSAANLWKNRSRYSKVKLNSGVRTRSYDFSKAGISLYPLALSNVSR